MINKCTAEGNSSRVAFTPREVIRSINSFPWQARISRPAAIRSVRGSFFKVLSVAGQETAFNEAVKHTVEFLGK